MRQELRSRAAIWRGSLAALVLLLSGVSASAALAAPTAVNIVDAIAPGQVTTELGLGTDQVSVPSGGVVTFMATTTPALPGTAIEIWSTTTTTVLASPRNDEDRIRWQARYFEPVTQRTVIQARLTGSATHQAATSEGRTATVDPSGRNVVRSVVCRGVVVGRRNDRSPRPRNRRRQWHGTVALSFRGRLERR
jgi:hypothetical protein